jgi:hypothetical protein
VLFALDILVKDKGWKAYEVKSSTSISDTYINDTAIQYYAITNSGIELKDISIVYINNQYIKKGDIDVKELFTIESVLDRGKKLFHQYPIKLSLLKINISRFCSNMIIIHCSTPYGCDFMGSLHIFRIFHF